MRILWNDFFLINSSMTFPIDCFICSQIIAFHSLFNDPTCYHFQSSVESITKLSIFCDVCLRDSNCLSSFQKRFVVCCLALS